jgi:hypothetical protein
VKRTNTKRATWKGRPGETYDLLVTSRPLGKRVNVHRWTDTNEVEVRAIDGDGRDPDAFHEYSNENLYNPSATELAEAEHRALQALAEARAGTRQPMTTEQRAKAASAPPTNVPGHLPHAHIKGPAVVVIYGEDMAERIVGPFPSGIDADLYICSHLDVHIGRPEVGFDERPRIDTWADVFPLEEPRK